VKKRLLLVMPCLLLTLLLAACGGGDSGGDGGVEDGGALSEEARVEQSIEEAAASKDPSKCTVYATPAYLEQRTGLTGEAAVEQCEKEAPETPDAEVAVSNVEVDGAKATAEVTFEGSDFDGQTVRVALARESGDWKTDEFVQFLDFDPSVVLKGIEEGLEEIAASKPEFVSCFMKRFEQLSEAKLEEIVLSERRAQQLSTKLATACSPAAS
jgi:hypothetical protein